MVFQFKITHISKTDIYTIWSITTSILEQHVNQVNTGELDLETAQAQALAAIKQLRYDGGTGYIWVNDTSAPYPKMLMHPTIPALDGQILDDPKYNTAMGKDQNLFQAFLEVCTKKGEGFVDYRWPKPTPTGLIPDVPKLSYVRLFADWGWIIGSGIYIDDAEKDILQKIKADIRSMRYANGTGYFWINDTGHPYPKMVMHPTVPALDGRVLDDPKYNNAMGENKNLFQAFQEITAKQQSGYVDYLWPKPTANGLTEEQPKLSYVKLYKPLGWIIGTGVYIDSIDKEVALKREELNQQINNLILQVIGITLLIILITALLSVWFASTLAKPIAILTSVAEDISLGNHLDQDIAETSRQDEIGTLAQAIDRLKISVKIMMDRLSS